MSSFLLILFLFLFHLLPVNNFSVRGWRFPVARPVCSDLSRIDSRNQPDGINWDFAVLRTLSLFLSHVRRTE